MPDVRSNERNGFVDAMAWVVSVNSTGIMGFEGLYRESALGRDS